TAMIRTANNRESADHGRPASRRSAATPHQAISADSAADDSRLLISHGATAPSLMSLTIANVPDDGSENSRLPIVDATLYAYMPYGCDPNRAVASAGDRKP